MNLWHVGGGTPRLLGSKCVVCGNRAFPIAPFCVRCGSPDVSEIELSSAGRVETSAGDDSVSVAEVRLDDGTLVFGRVAGALPRIGARVTFVPDGDSVGFVQQDQ